MKELSSKEKFYNIQRTIKKAARCYNVIASQGWFDFVTERILNAIEPPEIKVGMLGGFWDADTKSFPMYGCLSEIRSSEVPGNYKTTTEHIFDNFQPMTPEEIVDDIRKQMEEENEH